MFKKQKLLWGFLLFVGINVCLYLFILIFNKEISFNSYSYRTHAHHFLEDSRSTGGSFDLFNALGQYDAQWNLKISKEGYTDHPIDNGTNNKSVMDRFAYAFFPLYPALIKTSDIVVGNLEVSAFLVSNLLMILCFFSLYFVFSKFYKHHIAVKAIFLIFLFPFSIFFRSYFSEGLFLIELIWFSYFLIKKRWFLSATILGLLIVTRGMGIFLIPVFYFFLLKNVEIQKFIKQIFLCTIIAFAPIFFWITYCYFHTGDPFYFITVRTAWTEPYHILHNIASIVWFWDLPLHNFHFSKIDVITIITILILLALSRKTLRKEFWWISFALWLGPLLTTDTMSYTRYQIVSFPIFLYLSQTINGVKYLILLGVFGVGLFLISLLFVNWYWIG